MTDIANADREHHSKSGIRHIVPGSTQIHNLQAFFKTLLYVSTFPIKTKSISVIYSD